MPDREKIIEKIRFYIELNKYMLCDEEEEMFNEVLALLNEQDPVEPELEGGGSSWWHVCGECHGAIDTSDRYCKHCGRRIKHEEKAK